MYIIIKPDGFSYFLEGGSVYAFLNDAYVYRALLTATAKTVTILTGGSS
tara:strand:- start:661 stop:807 length:147 start_codon:yes stop_codon:yes gene_type:complete